MKNHKLLAYASLSIICVFVCTIILGCSTKHRVVNAKKNDQQVDKRDPIYQRLFKDTAALHTKHGVITVHRYKEKIYFEMPIALLGRDFLFKSTVTQSSDPNFVNMEGLPQKYFTIERTDTMILYKERLNYIMYHNTDSAQSEAIELSKGEPIFRIFRIDGYTRDSSNIIYDVTDFYKPTNKEIIDLKDKPYAPFVIISSVTPHTQTSFLNDIQVYDHAVTIENTWSASFDLSLLGYYTFPEKPLVSLRIETYLVLLPQQKMQPRMANQNIGTDIVPFYDYRPQIDTKWKYYTTRHRLEKEKGIVFYIDTLINEHWRHAIEDAAGEWNTVFERLGLGAPLKIQSYPRDTTFFSEDPIKNVIFLSNARTGTMGTANVIDPRTGEILGSRISVSRNAISTIRYLGILQLAAVDERFRSYITPDDAIYDALKGIALRTFGHALGLSVNYAGSYAYTPQQIRSAEFTKNHGFTASVMDDVLYNTLAQPGDKEKGVSLVVDRVGTADALALHYLYGHFGDEIKEEDELNALVRKYEGDPRYLYIGEYSIAPSDPRGQTKDLGNDPIAFLENRTANLKYLIRECANWFTSDSIPDNFKSGLPGFILQEYYGSILTPPLSYIGGVYVNEVNQKSSLPPYIPVDEAQQKNVVKALLSSYDRMDWLNTNYQLWQMAGVGTNVTEYVNRQGLPVRGLVQRLKYLSFGLPESKKNNYTHKEYLSDIESYLFSDIIQNKPMSQGKLWQLSSYISGLLALSPTLMEIDKINKGEERGTRFNDRSVCDMPYDKNFVPWLIYLHNADERALRRFQTIPYYTPEDFTPLVYEALGRVSKMLEKSKKHSKNPMYRGKMDFFLSIINKLQEPTKRL